MYKRQYVGCLTAIYDAKILGKMYMPKIRKRQDWALWIEIIKKIENCQSIQNFTAVYMQRSMSMSSNKILLLYDNFIFYDKVLGFGKIKSIYFMFVFLFHYFLKKIN